MQKLLFYVKVSQQKGGSMKKAQILVLLITLLVLSSCRSVVAPEFNLDPVVKKIKSENLEYKELLEKSDLVVKVKVKDELNLSNSIVKDENDFHAQREVEVLEVFEVKNEFDFSKTKRIVIKEAAAIDFDKVYYTSNHMPLSHDVQYVLFLSELKDGQYELVDGDNGVVNLDSIISNQNIETTVNSLFKYFDGTINNKKVRYVPLKLVDQPKNIKFERVTIKLKDFDIPVRIGKNDSTKKEYLLLGNFTFEFSEPIIDSIK